MPDFRPFFDRLLAEADSCYPSGRIPEKGSVLVHSSLRAFCPAPGVPVEGGAEAVLEGLLAASGERGLTVAMCAHGAPYYERTGLIARTFAGMKKVRKSAHPELTITARGPQAGKIVRRHRREAGLGDSSPLGTLYALDALVLMLGTGYESCTALHLAEYRAADRDLAEGKEIDRVTCWYGGKSWTDIAFHTEKFPGIGAAFEREMPFKTRRGPMPGAECPGWRMFRLRDIVDFSVDTCRYLG